MPHRSASQRIAAPTQSMIATGAGSRTSVSNVPSKIGPTRIAGIVAIAIGTLLLRSYGPRVRIGRLLAVTPTVTAAEARDLAASGTRRYVRVDGRLEADEEFPDEHGRPLVLRRRRIEARLRGGWSILDEQVQAVPFRLREGLDELGVDAPSLDEGLVTLAKESSGTAAEVADRLPARLPPETPIRLRIEQLSSVEHASVLGMPAVGTDGSLLMTRGMGRPLVVCTLERDDAMRVLADGRRARPIAAAIAFARLRRLYFGAPDPKGGAVENGPRFFGQATCHHRPEVYGGIGESESAALLRGFFAAQLFNF